MQYTNRFTIIAVLLLSIFAVSTTAQEELEEQTILTTFIPNIQYAPIYVGIAQGLYEDAGYDVSVEYLEEPQVVDLVASNINQIGIVSGEQVIQAVAQDRPITYVYEWWQEFPIGIVYSDAIEVNSVEDLVDLRVGIPGPFGANYSGLIALLNSAELDISDLTVDSIGFAAPDVFCVGGVDASVVYANNEPLQITTRAENGDCGDVRGVNVLRIGEVLNLVSNGLITNQETLENNPELVQTFVSIWDESLQLSINNPARAYLLSAPYIEGLPLGPGLEEALINLAEETDEFLANNPTREDIAENRATQYDALSEQFDTETLLQFQVLIASIDFWDAEQLGFSDGEAWSNMQETLITLGLLDEAIDVETYFTNDFLPMTEE
ncbi:MAG: ABC transporter substrate-binding protein [Chloroflexota bacterium]